LIDSDDKDNDSELMANKTDLIKMLSNGIKILQNEKIQM
jgi:hypothetical protein